MPNQCVHCGKLYPDGNKEILVGCSCGSRFFYFIKKEYYEKLMKKSAEETTEELVKNVDSLISQEPKIVSKQTKIVVPTEPVKAPQIESVKKPQVEPFKKTAKTISEIKQAIDEINKVDKVKMESDVREIIGVSEQEEAPVILDLESIRVIRPGKFEIDVVNLFNKKRPLIYKLEEGKYIIDLASTLKFNSEQIEEKANKEVR